MRSTSCIHVACLLGCLAFAPPRALGQSCNETGLPGVDLLIGGGAVVALQHGATIGQFLAALNQQFPTLNATATDGVPNRPIHRISFVPPSPANQAALDAWMTGSSMLAYHDFLYTSEAPEGKTGTVWVDEVISSLAYHNQYLLNKINVPAAHERSTGQGTVIAVLDTGIDFSHPALAGRAAAGGFSVIDNSGATSDAGDGIDHDGDGDINEMAGHGTYVAALIALVAPDARLLPVVVLNPDGVGDNWTITRGIYYAIDQGVEVINLSLGSTYDAEAVNAATLEARSHGIIVVAAAGNFDRNCPRERPAMDDDKGVLGVAALDDVDVKASFSNFNHRLFISAPGDSISSAQGGPNLQRSIISAVPAGDYRVWEGTSMATPIVSAAAALIRAQHPQWTASAATFSLTQARLALTAVNIYPMNPQFAGDSELGAGRIDIGAAVSLGPVAPAVGDLNSSGAIDFDDVLIVLAAWGQTHSSADVNNDGTVNFDDVLYLLMNWG